MSFAASIKSKMAEQGINQKTLAERAKLSAATVSQYLSGKIKPRPDALERIAEALGCTAWELTSAEVQERTRRERRPRIQSANRLSLKDASRLLGVNPQAIRVGIRQGTLPIGYSVRGGKNAMYIIPVPMFERATGIKVPRGESLFDDAHTIAKELSEADEQRLHKIYQST